MPPTPLLFAVRLPLDEDGPKRKLYVIAGDAAQVVKCYPDALRITRMGVAVLFPDPAEIARSREAVETERREGPVHVGDLDAVLELE